jgi:hypothetical protein
MRVQSINPSLAFKFAGSKSTHRDKTHQRSGVTSGDLARELERLHFKPVRHRKGDITKWERQATVSATIPTDPKAYVTAKDFNDLRRRTEALNIPLHIRA